MTERRKIAILVMMAAGWLLLGAATVQADIFLYVDNEGVLHFTNRPTSSDYRVYMKERPAIPKPSADQNLFDQIIEEAAGKHGLSFPLLKAMIKAESAFNPKAVSRKGAMGLMQIMPENLKLLNINDPFDPRQNIMGGALYFRSLLDRFNGELSLALAAYNAGPTTVDYYHDIPPIRETEDYVRKVLKFYYAFKNS